MGKRKDYRVNFILDVRKNRISESQFLLQIKYLFNNDERNYILKKLGKKYTQIAYNNPLPSDEHELAKTVIPIPEETQVEDEFNWYFDVITTYKTKINSYLRISQKLEGAILLGKVKEFKQTLNYMEDEVCVSYYGLLCEMHINHLDGNEELNKKLIQSLSNEDTAKLSILLEFSRLRMDRGLTPFQYDQSVENHKRLYDNDNQEIKHYIDFKFDPSRYDMELGDIAFVACYDSNLSVIDRYQSIKSLIIDLISYSSFEITDNQWLIDGIRRLENTFEDPFWTSTLLYLKLIPQKQFSNFSYLEIVDSYLNEDYDLVINKCIDVFEEDPTMSELYEIFVKSVIRIKGNITSYYTRPDQLGEILMLIHSVLTKKASYLMDREKLLKKYYSLHYMRSSFCLLRLIYEEYNFDLPSSVSARDKIGNNFINFEYVLANSDNDYISANLRQSKLSLHSFIESLPNINYQEVSGLKGRLLFYYYLKINDYDNCEQLLVSLKRNYELDESAYIDELLWVNKKLIKLYLKNYKLELASRIIVADFMKTKVPFDFYYLDNFIENIGDIDNVELNNDISLSLIPRIYNRPQGEIYDALANFLICQDVKVPSELIKKKSLSFNEKEVVYFFYNVCTKDNMEDSPYLNTIELLEEERIKILNYLKEIDANNGKKYNEEIRKLSAEQGIRKGLMQIHESRIFVDTKNLNKILEPQLELFEQYIRLTDKLQSGISSLKMNEGFDMNKFRSVFYFKEPVSRKDLIESLYTDLSTNPNIVEVPYARFEFFILLFNRIKHEFVYHADFGFKSFLSMRIRHGTFKNGLRSIFEEYNLVGFKSGSGEYEKIKYWEDYFKSNKEVITKIQYRLSEFSSSVDDLITKGLSWITINHDEAGNENSMFNFEFDGSQLNLLFLQRLGCVSNYPEFLENIYDVLFETLELNLESLRKKIRNTLKPELLDLLDILRADVSESTLKQFDKGILDRAIVKCTTDIQQVCDQISNWFKVSRNQYIEAFSIRMIIGTSMKYIDSVNYNALSVANSNISDNSDIEIKGQYFEYFADIFNNLLDNIISKNRTLKEDLKIDIQVDTSEDKFLLLIRNNLSEELNLKELKQTIKEINKKVEHYKTEAGEVESGFEEGSGYLKICKSIFKDLGRENYKVEPKINKKSFEVKIEFDLKGLLYERE